MKHLTSHFNSSWNSVLRGKGNTLTIPVGGTWSSQAFPSALAANVGWAARWVEQCWVATLFSQVSLFCSSPATKPPSSMLVDSRVGQNSVSPPVSVLTLDSKSLLDLQSGLGLFVEHGFHAQHPSKEKRPLWENTADFFSERLTYEKRRKWTKKYLKNYIGKPHICSKTVIWLDGWGHATW